MNTLQKSKIQLGTISHGTLRKEDLIPCFLDELSYLDTNNPVIPEIESKLSQDDYFESEDSDYDLEDLFDALNNLVNIPYIYFGNTQGDSSDFGYWIDFEAIEMDIYDHEITSFENEDIPDDQIGFSLFINDHGNTTLYYRKNKGDDLIEIWAVV